MIRTFNAEIKFKVIGSHPDIKYISNPDEIQTFNDAYSINTDYFYNTTEMLDHIKNDLQLVAGGGYNTDHIYHVYFDIKEVNNETTNHSNSTTNTNITHTKHDILST